MDTGMVIACVDGRDEESDDKAVRVEMVRVEPAGVVVDTFKVDAG